MATLSNCGEALKHLDTTPLSKGGGGTQLTAGSRGNKSSDHSDVNGQSAAKDLRLQRELLAPLLLRSKFND